MAGWVGQQVGNYRLLRMLGEVGFAEVYLARQVHLGTPVAIKVLSARLSAREVDLFREEARTIAQFKHPHIIHILDFGLAGSVSYLVNNTLISFWIDGALVVQATDSTFTSGGQMGLQTYACQLAVSSFIIYSL